MKHSIRLLSACSVLLLGMTPAWADICHVKTTGGGDGASWSSPASLQTALGDAACNEIWVAAGTYRPTADGDRAISFNIHPGVAVYGGFIGNESDRDARDPVAHLTVLSGDLAGNDGAGFENNGENSYNVVRMDGTGSTSITASTVLDGFTIRGGKGDRGIWPNFVGAGLYCDGTGAGHECSPTLSNLVFTFHAGAYGGAMFNDGRDGGTSSPTLSNVTLSNNFATFYGGAMVNNGDDGGTSSPTLINVTFNGNGTSASGGAMSNRASGSGGGTSSPTLINVTFSGNSTGGNGGAMFNGASGGTSSPTLINVTFSGNSADAGGAMHNVAGSGGAVQPMLRNVILWGNSAATSAEISNQDAAMPSIEHSIVRGSGGSIAWNAALGTDGGGNLDADPLLGLLNDNGGFTRTMLPGEGSAAIDAGDDATCAATDQRGVVRLFFAPCDIGAVEAGGLPILMVTDGKEYARYGQVVDYVVTLRNRTPSTFSGIALSSNVPAQFDEATMHWVCLGGGGAVCAPAGNGALADPAVLLPPYGALSWVLSARVRDDADEPGGIVLTVSAGGAAGVDASASDTNILTLFRAGLDVAGANGTQAIGGHEAASVSAACAPDGIAVLLPARAPQALVETVHGLRSADGGRIDVQRLGANQVRLLGRAVDGVQRASAWAFAYGDEVRLHLSQNGAASLQGAVAPLVLPENASLACQLQ